MNDVAHSLNNLLQQENIADVYSLHDADGRAIAVFASRHPETLRVMFGQWAPRIQYSGCVAIGWRHGEATLSFGRARE